MFGLSIRSQMVIFTNQVCLIEILLGQKIKMWLKYMGENRKEKFDYLKRVCPGKSATVLRFTNHPHA